MQNLHLKNLNNVDPIESYLNQLEKYENKIENLSSEKLTLFSEITGTENKKDNLNRLDNIYKKEEQIKKLKEKQKTLTSILLNQFLIEFERLEHTHYKNINITRRCLNDCKNNREQYVKIKELRYIYHNIKNAKKESLKIK